jgi:hypothetical protein
MLIDTYCPNYLISRKYAIVVNAPSEKVYPLVHSFHIAKSRLSKWLFRLRGLPTDSGTVEGLKKMGFIPLGDIPYQEVAFGLIGKFWTYSGSVQRLTADNFKDFQRKGFAKAVANITFKPLNTQKTLVMTETRVFCFDKLSTFYFRLYWAVVSPFSGLIRREWLKTIKREAEWVQ